MATYRYICQEHEEPEITEIQQSMKKEIPVQVPCQICGKEAERYWVGLKFYAIVHGAHGGGPATR